MAVLLPPLVAGAATNHEAHWLQQPQHRSTAA
jgi:hypothetical protein